MYHNLRDFWRHFGLCRAAAHSNCCFFCAVYKYSYLLTYNCLHSPFQKSYVSFFSETTFCPRHITLPLVHHVIFNVSPVCYIQVLCLSRHFASRRNNLLRVEWDAELCSFVSWLRVTATNVANAFVGNLEFSLSTRWTRPNHFNLRLYVTFWVIL